MRKLLVLSLLLGFSAFASADVLWDQSDYDTLAGAVVDQEFGDFPDFSAYLVTDVTADGPWTIQSVTTYFTFSVDSTWEGITQARLNIFDRTGALPDNGLDDPTAGTLVDITMTAITEDTLAMNASGLSIALAPGDYWVGLAPLADFGLFGQEFHRGAPIVGIDTAFRNPGGGFAVGTDWSDTSVLDLGTPWVGATDAAILIEGIPEPASLLLLGLAGLLIRRR